MKHASRHASFLQQTCFASQIACLLYPCKAWTRQPCRVHICLLMASSFLSHCSSCYTIITIPPTMDAFTRIKEVKFNNLELNKKKNLVIYICFFRGMYWYKMPLNWWALGQKIQHHETTLHLLLGGHWSDIKTLSPFFNPLKRKWLTHCVWWLQIQSTRTQQIKAPAITLI